MTILEAVQRVSDRLQKSGLEDSRRESEFLVAALLKVPPTHLLLKRHLSLPEHVARFLDQWADERQARKPLAYIVGEQPFRDLTLEVTPDVLIPRPETELLVEQAMKLLDQAPADSMVVDVGTGCGNIAISLAGHARVRRVIGIDVSVKALEVAQRNAQKSGRAAKCEWFQGDLLLPVCPPKVDIQMVVANLPYVRTSEMDALAPELSWEPRLALDGGPDGLRLLARGVRQAKDVLVGGGHLLLEIGMNQSRDVVRLLDGAAAWEDIEVFTDLACLPRIVQARRKG
jgi:release factor glutamine methyltransferase